MSGTHCFYNGILMQDCETRDFQQTVEYDESGTDAMFNRFRISVVARIVSVDPAPPAPDPEDEDAPPPPPPRDREHPSSIRVAFGTDPEAVYEAEESVDRLAIIRSRLWEPRKDFWLAVNGANSSAAQPTPTIRGKQADPLEAPNSYRILLAATGDYSKDPTKDETQAYPKFIRAFGYTGAIVGSAAVPRFTNAVRVDHIDVDEGPKPRDVAVSITGGGYFRVEFTIDICVSLCRGDLTTQSAPVRDARKVKGVISNRWSVTELLDAEFKTSHIIEGTLVVANHRYKAQAMRTMVQPALFPYAKMEGRSFAVDKSGLKLAYQFTIKETGIAPPPGVIDWDGKYTESTGVGYGRMHGHINLTVRGAIKRPPGMTAKKQKTVMIRALYAMLQGRITSINPDWKPLPGQNAKTAVIRKVVVVENMKRPELELTAEVEYTQKAKDAFNNRLENMGNPFPIPGYDERWWPTPNYFQWDTASENALADSERGGGSYFDSYNQGPCNLWHAMPRYAKTDEIILARPDGGNYPPDPGEADPANAKNDPTYNSRPFVAYQVPDLKGELGPVDELPPVTADRFGINEAIQQEGFPYLKWESWVDYFTNYGKIQLPLSRTREHPQGRAAMTSKGWPANSMFPREMLQTSIAVALHAPMAKRCFRVLARRQGAWPMIPKPRAEYQDKNGYFETLLSCKIVPETPELSSDDSTLEYSIQMFLEYALSRDPGGDTISGNVSSFNAIDTLRSGSSPIDRTGPLDNRISVLDIFDLNTIEDDAGYVVPTYEPPPGSP